MSTDSWDTEAVTTEYIKHLGGDMDDFTPAYRNPLNKEILNSSSTKTSGESRPASSQSASRKSAT